MLAINFINPTRRAEPNRTEEAMSMSIAYLTRYPLWYCTTHSSFDCCYHLFSRQAIEPRTVCILQCGRTTFYLSPTEPDLLDRIPCYRHQLNANPIFKKIRSRDGSNFQPLGFIFGRVDRQQAARPPPCVVNRNKLIGFVVNDDQTECRLIFRHKSYCTSTTLLWQSKMAGFRWLRKAAT